MTLRDALEMWNRGEIVVEVSPGRWQAIHKATDALIGAARRVAEAPERDWCEEHFSLGDTSEKCEGILYYERRVQGTVEFTPCRMVRKLLVDPPKENQ